MFVFKIPPCLPFFPYIPKESKSSAKLQHVQQKQCKLLTDRYLVAILGFALLSSGPRFRKEIRLSVR